MMIRVSSRQRLVSWDAFDATAHVESDEDAGQEDGVTCYESSLSRHSSYALYEDLDVGGSLSRKRERGDSKVYLKATGEASAPAIITALAWELGDPDIFPDLFGTTTKSPPVLKDDALCLDKMMSEVQLHLLSYLSDTEKRTMAMVSSCFRELLHSRQAVSLWTESIHQRWPPLKEHADGFDFVDRMNLSTAVCQSPYPVNFAFLMGMAAHNVVTGVDKSLLDSGCASRRYTLRGRVVSPQPAKSVFSCLDNGAVQYNGPIGMGDRCIRGNAPLAAPERVGPNKVCFEQRACTVDTIAYSQW